MDFFLGDGPYRLRSGAGLVAAKLSINSKTGTTTATILKQGEASVDDAVTIGQKDFASSPARGEYSLLANVRSSVNAISDLTGAIKDIREEQVRLNDIQTENPTGRYTTELDAEFERLDAEAQRLATERNSRGERILGDAATFSLSVTAANLNDAIALPYITNQISSFNDFDKGISSQEGALRVESSMKAALYSFRNVASAVDAASDKADRLVAENPVQAIPSKEKVTDIESAQELASQIASQIGSPFNSEEATLRIIEASAAGLKSERVQGLLD